MSFHASKGNTDHEMKAACPLLKVALGPGDHYAVPCALNICRADPLRRKGPRDLPLTCQADWCLSGHYRSCPYWRSCDDGRISLVEYVVRHMRAIYAVCARALQA